MGAPEGHRRHRRAQAIPTTLGDPRQRPERAVASSAALSPTSAVVAFSFYLSSYYVDLNLQLILRWECGECAYEHKSTPTNVKYSETRE